jgi:predicted DCC family thiol-disulfide oxidoreductase YuxK
VLIPVIVFGVALVMIACEAARPGRSWPRVAGWWWRAALGTYLCVHFLWLLPWGTEVFSNRGVLPQASASPVLYLFPNVLALCDAPAFVTALLAVGAVLSVLFAAGKYDRVAAVVLWYVWACLFGRNPLIANPSLPFVGWMLLAHAFLPPAPYGSWAARGRLDPGGGWRMPPAIFLAAWVVMSLGYTYSGYTKLVSPSWVDGTALARVLDNPLARPGPLREALLALPGGVLRVATWGTLALELGFAPLALFRRSRPWVWGAMLLMHLGLIVLIDFAELSLGMVLLHFFTWDPGWVRPLARPTERLYYDGHCGLCHRCVRFLLAEDRAGDAFRFAPLGGNAFRAEVAEADRKDLPDGVVVYTAGGAILTRSAAVLHAMRRLGGLWRLLAGLAAVVPAALWDRLYDGIARVRHHLFAAPPDVCPLLPPSLRQRFDL